jgi:hypothetical protein
VTTVLFIGCFIYYEPMKIKLLMKVLNENRLYNNACTFLLCINVVSIVSQQFQYIIMQINCEVSVCAVC